MLGERRFHWGMKRPPVPVEELPFHESLGEDRGPSGTLAEMGSQVNLVPESPFFVLFDVVSAQPIDSICASVTLYQCCQLSGQYFFAADTEIV